jgi:hypothetical protein
MLDGQGKRLSSGNAWDNSDRLHRPHRIHRPTGSTFPNPVDNQSGDEEIPIAKRYHSNSLAEDRSPHQPNSALPLFGPVGHSCLLKNAHSHAYHIISFVYDKVKFLLPALDKSKERIVVCPSIPLPSAYLT